MARRFGGLPWAAQRAYGGMSMDIKDSGEIEILTDCEKKTTVRLKELVPDRWGEERFL